MISTLGFGATKFLKTLSLKKFERESAGDNDVELDVLFCGVCHSDIHQVKNDWNNTVYPCVPGHELVGKVAKVGRNVTGFKVGDLAAVGCITDSCGVCHSCGQGEEQYCEAETGMLGTYNGPMNPTGQNTYGGYTNHFVIKEKYLLKLPAGLSPATAAPLLCAGTTTYSPLKHWGVKPGMKVGIAGMGGLGHVAVKIAKAMGADVTVISTSIEKRDDALAFGAIKFVLVSDKEQMKEASHSLDLILSTIPYKHDVEPYLDLLHRDAVMVMVGILMPMPSWNPMKIIMQRQTLAGSLIGGIKETQEMLEFCATHEIAPEIELISVLDINDAFAKVKDKLVRYRYVIDLSSMSKVDASSADEIAEVSHILAVDMYAKIPVPEVLAQDDRLEFRPGWE
jgi:alcohol dehydrogenase (NADP+)